MLTSLSNPLLERKKLLEFHMVGTLRTNKISHSSSKPALILVLSLLAALLLLLPHAGKAQPVSTNPLREQTSCPDLTSYYPSAFFEENTIRESQERGSASPQQKVISSTAAIAGENPIKLSEWLLLADELAVFQNRCLRSSEYFALMGGAQLNAGQIGKAYESLERSLLLDPNNGAAQIDYSSVLYDMGQRYAALEINQLLLARNDLPEHLRQLAEFRNSEWRDAAKEHTVRIGATRGYDNNLNGAPDIGQITLTLVDGPISFDLGSDMIAQSGAFSNLTLTSTQRTFTESGQRSWINEVRGRVSNNSDTDLFQLNTQYSIIDITRKRGVLWESGATNLNFGGNTLYSAVQSRFRYQLNGKKSCSPTAEAAMQLQYFSMQPTLNGLETRIAAGLSCAASNQSSYGVEIAYITNRALKTQRPGKDRRGQMASFRYQRQIGSGEFYAQTSFVNFKDETGYSPLIADAARRWQDRWSFDLQYRAPFMTETGAIEWMINASHQAQRSNIGLFRQSDRIIELGISFLL